MKLSLNDLVAYKFWTIGSLCDNPKHPQVISYFVFVALHDSSYGSVFEYMEDGILIWQFNFKFSAHLHRRIIEIEYDKNKKEHRIMLGILMKRDAFGKYQKNDKYKFAYDIEEDKSIKLSKDILKINYFLKEVNMTKEFTGPDRAADERDWEESQNQNRPDWDKLYWKPVSGDENLIRILPGIGGARYHFKGGKHFIKHPDRTEMFICNLDTYGKPCPACEEEQRLIDEGDADAAKGFKSQTKGVFNVIDRTNPDRGVIIWECPPVAVWERIIGIVKGKSKFNNLVGTEEEPLMGRDIVVTYNPKATPQFKYDLQFDAVSPLGRKKEVTAWLATARALIPQEVYPEVDYAVAKIKTFGSKEEREELRKKLSAQYDSKEKKKTEEKAVEKDVEAERKKKEDEEKIAELERQLAQMKAGGAGAKEEAKPKKEKPVEKEVEDDEEDAPEEDVKEEAVEEEDDDGPSMADLRKQLEEAEKREAKKEQLKAEVKVEKKKPVEKEEVVEEDEEEAAEEEDDDEEEKTPAPKKGEETAEELALKIAKIRAQHQ